jgi:hypothetical protein
MEERKQRSGEDRRQDIERGEVSVRRVLYLLLYNLLIFNRLDNRSGSDRRRGIQKKD